MRKDGAPSSSCGRSLRQAQCRLSPHRFRPPVPLRAGRRIPYGIELEAGNTTVEAFALARSMRAPSAITGRAIPREAAQTVCWPSAPPPSSSSVVRHTGADNLPMMERTRRRSARRLSLPRHGPSADNGDGFPWSGRSEDPARRFTQAPILAVQASSGASSTCRDERVKNRRRHHTRTRTRPYSKLADTDRGDLLRWWPALTEAVEKSERRVETTPGKADLVGCC